MSALEENPENLEDLTPKYFYNYVHSDIDGILDVIKGNVDIDSDDYDNKNKRIEVLNNFRENRKRNIMNHLLTGNKKSKVHDESIDDSVDVLSEKLNKVDISKKYLTVLFNYEVLHEEECRGTVNTCLMNLFIGSDNSIKAYKNFVNYTTIKDKYIEKRITFEINDKYDLCIILLNTKLKIKSTVNEWKRYIGCYDRSSDNLFQCLINDDMGINQHLFKNNIKIQKKDDEYPLLKIIVDKLSTIEN